MKFTFSYLLHLTSFLGPESFKRKLTVCIVCAINCCVHYNLTLIPKQKPYRILGVLGWIFKESWELSGPKCALQQSVDRDLTLEDWLLIFIEFFLWNCDFTLEDRTPVFIDFMCKGCFMGNLTYLGNKVYDLKLCINVYRCYTDLKVNNWL